MHKNVEMLFKSNTEGQVTPLVMKIEDENNGIVKVKLHSPLLVEEIGYKGNKAYIYTCKAENNGTLRDCKLMYDLDLCTWSLIDI